MLLNDFMNNGTYLLNKNKFKSPNKKMDNKRGRDEEPEPERTETHDPNLLEVWRLAIDNPDLTPIVRLKMMRSANNNILDYITRRVNWQTLLNREFGVPSEWIRDLRVKLPRLNLRWLYSAFAIHPPCRAEPFSINTTWIHLPETDSLELKVDYGIFIQRYFKINLNSTPSFFQKIVTFITDDLHYLNHFRPYRTNIQADFLEFNPEYTYGIFFYYAMFTEGYFPVISVNENDRNIIFTLKSEICAHCSEKAKHVCGTCKEVGYCSSNCQKQDWTSGGHARICK